MPRLFVAIDLPDTHVDTLQRLRTEAFDARWTPAEQYHLTLRFIGDTAADRVPAIEEALGSLSVPAFILRGKGLGVFPSRRRPRVLFANVDQTTPLVEVQADVERACQRAGLDPDPKAFHPHVTIARLKGARPREVRSYLKTHQGVTLAPFTVQQFHLYESRLHPEGALHERVRTFSSS